MRILLLAWLAVVSAVAASQNQLAGHASPYLAMHGADPVHWRDWGDAALADARRDGRLILISSGYFACHWCHVMQRESYRDPAVAQLLNDHFVAVKLDRELHPALDAYLIDFVERTQGQAGWPLNVILTPEGYPLVGMTYLPRDQFHSVLEQLVDRWAERRESLTELARRAAGAGQQAPAGPLEVAPQRLRQRLLDEALALADDLGGGFGRESRFPMAPQLLVLLELQAAQPSTALGEFLVLTLDQMAGEGLRDHLAGGFFRYTVDPTWQVPHYEKMLYTQALLARVYLRAAELFGRGDYAAVAADTLDFVLARMAAPGGGYSASLSAVDGAGEEGGAYLWSEAQLRAVLADEDLALARRHWRLEGTPPTQGGYLPRRGEPVAALAAAAEGPPARLQQRLDTIRERLLAARDRRVLPRDDKVLAGWNALLLGALADAGRQLDAARFRSAAAALAEVLLGSLWDGRTLLRARGPDGPLGAAALEDYAYLADALDRYARLVGDPQLRGVRDALLVAAWERFYQEGSGWRQGGETLLPAMPAHAALGDGPMPSPAAELIRLSAVAALPELQQRAARAKSLAAASVLADPFWFATHALGWLADPAGQAGAASAQR